MSEAYRGSSIEVVSLGTHTKTDDCLYTYLWGGDDTHVLHGVVTYRPRHRLRRMAHAAKNVDNRHTVNYSFSRRFGKNRYEGVTISDSDRSLPGQSWSSHGQATPER